MSLETLSIEEKKLLKYCIDTEEYDNPLKTINISRLQQAEANNIDISSIFLNQYTLRKKIKEAQMKQFNEELTNKEKIYEAEKEGIYGTKTMKVGDIELIDFGNMPVSFARHNSDISNSIGLEFYGKEYDNDTKNEYLTYDGEDGISTISATPMAESTELLHDNVYLYWNFKENEVMSLKEGEEGDLGDGLVSHKKKQVVSEGFSNRHIKRI